MPINFSLRSRKVPSSNFTYRSNNKTQDKYLNLISSRPKDKRLIYSKSAKRLIKTYPEVIKSFYSLFNEFNLNKRKIIYSRKIKSS
jgi:hypothetical protein